MTLQYFPITEINYRNNSQIYLLSSSDFMINVK